MILGDWRNTVGPSGNLKNHPIYTRAQPHFWICIENFLEMEKILTSPKVDWNWMIADMRPVSAHGEVIFLKFFLKFFKVF